MGKYLLLWEIDQTKVPVDPKERAVAWTRMMKIVKQDLERGITKDWGAIPGQRGYAISEGTEVEIVKLLQQYIPYITFKVHPVVSVSQTDEVLEAMLK
jgi:hypothetical protein